MKKLLKKALLLLIPFMVLAVLFMLFEPYDYWGLRGDPLYMSRSLSSLREVMREQPDKIVLGDSRMANFNADYIEEQSGERYTMMCYGGATLGESVEQFWFAAEHTKLKKVVIGLNFYTMNDGHYSNERFPLAKEKALDATKFVFNYNVWLDMFNNMYTKAVNGIAALSNNPSMAIEVDDPSSLTQNKRPPGDYSIMGYRIDLQNYAYTIEGQCSQYEGCWMYMDMLEEVIDYCEQNDIELVFVIPNSNRAIWDIVVYPYGIDAYIEQYKDFLKSRATVYDMEFYNDYAANDSLFYDGFHFVLEEKMRLARVFFADEADEFCVRTTKEQYLAQKQAASADAQTAAEEQTPAA